MKTFRIPYHKTTLDVSIPDSNFKAVLESRVHGYCPGCTQTDIIENALNNPIASPKLEKLVRGKKNVVIVTSDHTRPVPSRITLPALLHRIRQSEPDIEIKILVATGYHRPTTRDEQIDKFGGPIVENEHIIIHESGDQNSLVQAGILPSGGELWLNRHAVETDLLIAEGFIEPHFFAGFSGGRKAILPGIAGATTVLANHCAEFIASPYARTGVLEKNPIHEDMVFAAEKVNLAFIINVVINSGKEVIHAFAGHREEAHLAGCRFLKDLAYAPRAEADIVITSNGGYPLDQNVYQSVKGMTAAEATCKEGGVIIMVAGCQDGHGGQSFYDNLAGATGPDEILKRVITIPMDKTVPDQWEFQILARILKKHKVIFVTGLCDPDMIRDMHMEHAKTANEALNRALEIKGKDASVAVIPDGVSVIVG